MGLFNIDLGNSVNSILEAGDIAGQIYSQVPDDQETAVRNEINADRSRLAKGAGGLGAGARNRLLAEGNQQIQAATNERLANLARGANTEAGASGQLATAQNQLNAQALGANAQLQSNVRAQDLAEAERQRNELWQKEQFVINKQQERKTGFSTSTTLGSTGYGAGQADRYTTGNNISSGTNSILGSAGDAGATDTGSTSVNTSYGA